jgi:hypothetical protein
MPKPTGPMGRREPTSGPRSRSSGSGRTSRRGGQRVVRLRPGGGNPRTRVDGRTRRRDQPWIWRRVARPRRHGKGSPRSCGPSRRSLERGLGRRCRRSTCGLGRCRRAGRARRRFPRVDPVSDLRHRTSSTTIRRLRRGASRTPTWSPQRPGLPGDPRHPGPNPLRAAPPSRRRPDPNRFRAVTRSRPRADPPRSPTVPGRRTWRRPPIGRPGVRSGGGDPERSSGRSTWGPCRRGEAERSGSGPGGLWRRRLRGPGAGGSGWWR